MKLSVCALAGSLIPSGLAVSWGPCNDKTEAPEVPSKATTSSQPKTHFADAGYDADCVYQFCREDWQVESVINPAVHRADVRLNGKYRSEMKVESLKAKEYGRRWLVESYMSGLKRTTGHALSARSERSLFVEAALRVLAYALRR